MSASYAAVIIIAVLFLFMFMIGLIFNELKKVLINNIQEAIVGSGEDIIYRLDLMQNFMTTKITALQSSIASLADMISMIKESPSQSPEIEGMLSIVNELQRETDKFLRDFAAKVEKSSQINNKTLEAFDEEIKKFTNTITKSIKEIQKASDEHNKLLAMMASSFQGVLTTTGADIQNAFAKTDDDLKTIITESMKKINRDYEDNIRQIFQAMADNLASIKEALKKRK